MYYAVASFLYFFIILGMIFIATWFDNIFLVTALDILWIAICVYVGIRILRKG